jgi:hypothetical protein
MPTVPTGIVGLLEGGSASFRARNAHLLKPAGPSNGPPAGIHASAPKRIRQRQGDGMNKWEREFRDYIAPQFENIHREVSLPLANGLRYKLDFLCVDKLGVVMGYEVKGFARSTGIAKLKMAASVYPWIKFVLVTKQGKMKGGGWDKEAVMP